jgi:H+-transporting ATPase
MPSASGGVFDVFASGSGSSKKKNKKVADSSDRGKYENSPLNPALSGATTYSTSEDADKPKKDNPADHDWGLTTEDAERRLEKWGYNELPSSRKGKWEMLLDTLLTPMACIIWISIFIEMGVALRLYLLGDTGPTGPMQDFIDMWVLVFLQFFNSFVGWHEEIKAGDAVAELQKSLAPKASVKRNGKWVDLPGRQVVPGDLVCLPLGGAVPADCRLIAGSKPLMIDQASLTGESLPVKFTAGGCAKMGSTVVQGEAEAIVEETGKWTFFGKTASLLNEADNGEDCNLNEKLFYILLFIVFFGIPCVVTVLIVLADRYKEDPHYSVVSNVAVVIVAIVPIANAVVCTSTLAFGSLIMSKEGAIVTRLTSIEEMAGMSMLCSDKTGTLTLNKMVMQTVIANMREIGADTYSSGSSPNKAKRAQNAQKKKNNQNNEEEEGPSDLLKSFVFPEQVSANPEAQDVLKYATLAAKWKETPKDALDTLTINASKARLEEFDGGFKQLDYEPFDPSIKRTSALLEATDGRRFWATKGAPPVVLKLCHNYAEIGDEVEKVIDDLGDRGIRSLAVAISRGEEKKDWVFVGMLTFLDPPRPDTKLTIERAHELGVSVKMITGDQLKVRLTDSTQHHTRSRLAAHKQTRRTQADQPHTAVRTHPTNPGPTRRHQHPHSVPSTNLRSLLTSCLFFLDCQGDMPQPRYGDCLLRHG